MSLPPTTASAPLKLTVGGAHAAAPAAPTAPLEPPVALGPPLAPPPPLVTPPAPPAPFTAPATDELLPAVDGFEAPPVAGAPLAPVDAPAVPTWPGAPATLDAPAVPAGVEPVLLCEQLIAENRQTNPDAAEIEPSAVVNLIEVLRSITLRFVQALSRSACPHRARPHPRYWACSGQCEHIPLRKCQIAVPEREIGRGNGPRFS